MQHKSSLRRWKHWRLAILMAVLLLPCLTASRSSALAGSAPDLYMLDPLTGSWLALPEANDLAGLSIGQSGGGACDKEEWPNPVNVHVTVYPGGQELLKTAEPISANIRTMPDGSFQVPMYQAASWRLHLAVTNLHDAVMTDISLTDNFGAEFAVLPGTPSQGRVTVNLTGAAQKVHLVWAIGSLSPGQSAQLDLVVTTKLNPAGRQEFTSPGLYALNPGAHLTYLLLGARHENTSDSIFVTALPADKWGDTDTGRGAWPGSRLEMQPLNVEFLGDAAANLAEFTEEFQPLTPVIGVRPPGFEVPQDTFVAWQLTLRVKNISAQALTQLHITENLGAELEVDQTTVRVLPAGLAHTLSIYRQGNMRISWSIPCLEPGAEASLVLTVYTGTENGKQLYATPTPDASPNYLNSGAVLKFNDPDNHSVGRCPVPVWVMGGYMQININATTYQWLIRKPGVFAAAPLVIRVYTNRRVAVTFSGFEDLAPVLPGGGRLPAFYGVGQNLADVQAAGWLSAADLNRLQLTTESAGIWQLWPSLRVAKSTAAGEYEDLGYLTFTLQEISIFVDRGHASDLTLPGFKGVSFSGMTRF